MKIAQITPSAGGSFYCENCLRDANLVKVMINLGHDVSMIPLYLPLQVEQDTGASKLPIFFGGINVYLQQKSAIFRRTPRWLDSLFDSPKLLSWISSKAGMTSAKDLGETTISMLQGENGRQIKELDRLVEWLSEQENKPDIVCLSNILLAGLTRSIKQKLNVPVVCLLQDEDGFLDGLQSPYSEQAWQIIAERATEIDAHVAVSKYFAEAMTKKLELDPKRMHIVYTGISLEGYESEQCHPEIPTIGYLSRQCPSKGLDTLVDAFITLKKNDELRNTKLRITGGKTVEDKAFINQVQQKLSSCSLINDVEFLDDFVSDAKYSFLRTLSVLSVPEKLPVACGMYVLEALAAGVPVVEPENGVFPELLKMTGGGLLFEPNNAEALAGALKTILLKPDYARKLGKQGRKVVFEKFDINQTARDLMRIYEGITK
jgi:glycosyltransferase involved in cell wall biosynthesis